MGSALPKPPQGHSGYGRRVAREPPRGKGNNPPRYTNRNSKQRMLQAALEAARERGYEAMRIFEITDPIGLTHQAFYAHFRDKRHCMCEAIDPRLGAIERMAAALSESDPDSAAKLAHTLDDLIAERFGSQDGTRGRLVSAMIELLRSEGSFHKVRIGALVKTAHVPPGDFYRQFTGKQECFAAAYGRLLGELITEVRRRARDHIGHGLPALLDSLADALDSDPERRRILIVLMANLPDEAPGTADGTTKAALSDAIAGLLADVDGVTVGVDDPALGFAAASVVEVIRFVELADHAGSPQDRLRELTPGIDQMLTAAPLENAPANGKLSPADERQGPTAARDNLVA